MVQYLLKLFEAGLEALDNPPLPMLKLAPFVFQDGAIFIETARSWT